MAWDSETHRGITLAKLKFASPDSVYEALREYAEHLGPVPYFNIESELEETLLARNDPLINLGLARYGADADVLGALYRRGLEGSGDAVYDKGLRLGCLSNLALRSVLNGSASVFAMESDSPELSRLAREGDADEIAVLMRNPAAGRILGLVYLREPPFDALDSDRLFAFVRESVTNPRINLVEDNEDGPDMVAYDIHKGIYELLRTAPVDRKWLYTLHSLLRHVDPQAVRTPDNDPRDALSHWGDFKLKRRSGNDDEEMEGVFTSLGLVEEFRCMVAALYGRRLDDKQGIVSIGVPDSPDVVLRCAYYGSAALTKEVMRAGYERDGAAFTLAALANTHLFHKRDLRVELEDMISGDLRRLYVERCEQIHKRWPNFDPRPVSESGRDVLDDVIESKPTEEMAVLSRIDAGMSELQRGLSAVFKVGLWGLMAVLAAIIYTNW